MPSRCDEQQYDEQHNDEQRYDEQQYDEQRYDEQHNDEQHNDSPVGWAGETIDEGGLVFGRAPSSLAYI